jgi:hypothetical protein
VRRDRTWTAIVILGGLLALACAFFGLLVGFEDDWDSTAEQAAFIAATLLGASILLAGVWISRRREKLGAGLIILGALVCGFMIWWTIVAGFVALAVIVLTIVWIRRPLVASS